MMDKFDLDLFPNANKMSWDLGLCLLCLLLIVQPFHFYISEKFVYYREISALIFSLLFFLSVLKSKGKITISNVLLLIILFPFLLIGYSSFDTGFNLYQSDYTLASGQLLHIDPSLYLLRNAFLYIPMVCYFSFRGFSKREIHTISAIIALVAPLSILAFISKYLSQLTHLTEMVELGGCYTQYNNYVPYLTFPFMASLYLFLDLEKGVLKYIFCGIMLFIFLYLIVSTSRQSFLFAILVILGFLKYSPIKIKKRIFSLLLIISFTVMVAANYSISHYNVHEKISSRYSSLQGFGESRRFEIMAEGLKMLKPHQFIFGAGLTSVVYSGPHNDYIRWTQRIGLPGMIFGFLPFFLAFKSVLNSLHKGKRETTLTFILCSIFFTIYHSFFSYPRDDAFQSLYVYLGITLWLAVSQKNKMGRLKCTSCL